MSSSQFTLEDLQVVVDEAARVGLPVAAHAHGTESVANAVAAGVHTVEHCTWLAAPGPGYDQRAEVAAQMARQSIAACVAWPVGWRRMLERLPAERAATVGPRIRWMDELGVPLIPGTDSGLSSSVFDDYAQALRFYEYLGFSPERVLDMATATSAAALGLGDRTGQLKPGYSADMLVCDGNPLDGLHALERVRLVLTRGRPAVGALG